MRIEKENKLIPVVESAGVNKPTIHTIHILDGSQSMGSRWSEPSKFTTAKSGIAEEIETLKSIKDINYVYTIIEFSAYNRISTLCDRVPIEEIDIDKLDFFPPQGCTALFDTLGKTLSSLLENKTNDVVVIKIFTDGGENDSKSYNTLSIKSLIGLAEKAGIVVTFVGTNMDVQFMVNNLNLSNSNTLSHNNTPEGVKAAYSATMDATIAFSKSVVIGESNTRGFYSQDSSNIKK